VQFYTGVKFENRVLRRTFGPKWDKMVGARRKLHNEQLHNLYSSLNIIYNEEVRWAGDESHKEEKRNAYRILLGNPEGRDH
jgi:hypothetical protein